MIKLWTLHLTMRYSLNVKVRWDVSFYFVSINFRLVILATVIAERAAAALKESRRQRRQVDIGTPTWTGRSGAAGAPRGFSANKNTSSPRFGKKNAFPMNDTPTSSNYNKFGSGNVSGFNSRVNNQDARPSSSTLLARMRERKALETGGSSSDARGM